MEWAGGTEKAGEEGAAGQEAIQPDDENVGNTREGEDGKESEDALNKEDERYPVYTSVKYITAVGLCVAYAVIVGGMFICSYSWVLNCTALYLICCNLLAFLMAALKDPGFLPQREEDRLKTIRLSDGTVISPNIDADILSISTGGTSTELKYCKICDIYRPVGSAHCELCGHCVLEKDHHCIMLSNCIGRNNMAAFYLFVGTLSVVLCIDSAYLFGTAEWFVSPTYRWYFRFLGFLVAASGFVFFLFLFVPYVYLSLVNTPSRRAVKDTKLLGQQWKVGEALGRMITMKPVLRSRREPL